MNENAKEWVKALRSGDYKQGHGRLHVDDTYCCLGVACDLFIKQGGTLEVTGTDLFGKNATSYNGGRFVLPFTVMAWLGLKEENGTYEDDGIHTLTDQNDTGDSFEQIADTIESEPEGLFV